MIENNFAWMIERKIHGYRPFQDGDWELYSCAGYGLESDVMKEVGRLQSDADEYTSYRAVKSTRHDPQRQRLVDALKAFVDDEECSFDHHGYCQTHGVTKPCINAEARAVLNEVAE